MTRLATLLPKSMSLAVAQSLARHENMHVLKHKRTQRLMLTHLPPSPQHGWEATSLMTRTRQ